MFEHPALPSLRQPQLRVMLRGERKYLLQRETMFVHLSVFFGAMHTC